MKQQMNKVNADENKVAWEPFLEKMPVFGTLKKSYNFEWPTQDMVEKWPLDRNIQLQRIQSNWSSLKSIQFYLTQDITGAELAASERSVIDKDIMLNIAPLPGEKRSVPIIEIGVKQTGQLKIEGLRFKYATGDIHTIYQSEGPQSGIWKVKPVPEGYEIIGLYGESDQDSIYSLGFIIWKPNPEAF